VGDVLNMNLFWESICVLLAVDIYKFVDHRRGTCAGEKFLCALTCLRKLKGIIMCLEFSDIWQWDVAGESGKVIPN